MAKRPKEEFVVGDWVDLQTAVEVVDDWKQYSTAQKPNLYRLVPVSIAAVRAKAARERKARKGK